jgi:hypothetical protein
MNEDTKEIVIANTNIVSVDNVVQQFKMVHELYEKIMVKDEHYGTIPGTKKDTLYKSGAEKLDLLFKLVPKIDEKIMRELGNDHREVEITIGLYHKETGLLWGQGIGSCSTKETKFRYREGKRLCSKCGKDSIIKGKEEYGGGWLCYKKTGGCGEKFADNDTTIINQQVGRIENTDIADIYNTVLKMAYKRALVSATITATGVSDIFTQDLDDFVDDKKIVNKVKDEFQGQEINDEQTKFNLLSDEVKDRLKLTGWTKKQIQEKCRMYDFNNDKLLADVKSVLDNVNNKFDEVVKGQIKSLKKDI